jgi:hypothetical protein
MAWRSRAYIVLMVAVWLGSLAAAWLGVRAPRT